MKPTPIKNRLENMIISDAYTHRKKKTKRDWVIKTGIIYKYTRFQHGNGWGTWDEDGKWVLTQPLNKWFWDVRMTEVKVRYKLTKRQLASKCRIGVRYIPRSTNYLRALWLGDI